MNSALREFTRDVDSIVGCVAEPADIAGRVAMRMRPLLRQTNFLEPRHRVPGATYQQHLVHVDPEGRYSVVALVWLPGQATPIHDHRCWCVVGVLEGCERETEYHLIDDGPREVLLRQKSEVSHRGAVCALVPPAENIHRVENAGAELAVSIHVYGDDIAKTGSSINRIFDNCVVRAADDNSPTVSWRAADERALNGYTTRDEE